MQTLWKYAENTFEVVTRGSFKLMNILITDHAARCQQFSNDEPANQTLIDTLTDALTAKGIWDAAYAPWLSCRGLYKGSTQAFYDKLDELATLKIRQWDVLVQGTFLEGTPEYTSIFPQGRAPFQKGSLDQRVTAVEVLGTTMQTYSSLGSSPGQVIAYHAALVVLRSAQQQKEAEVDTCSATLELARHTTARHMYRNLARFMEIHWDNPVQIEDCYDMNYIRDGAPPPPEDEPAPPPPAP